MNKQYWIWLLLLLLTSPPPVFGQTFGVLKRGEAGRSGDSVSVSLWLNPEWLELPATEVLTIVPRLVADDDSLELPAIHVLGRQAYYRYLRHDNLGLILPADRVVWSKRRWRPFAYVEQRPWQEWMNRAVLKVQLQWSDCHVEHLLADSALQHPIQATRTSHRTTAPTTDRVSYTVSERMHVIFPLDRTEVHPELYDNRHELDKIRRSLDDVRTDSSLQLRQVTIKGYASPEGPYRRNERLARERTDSIASFVARHYTLDPRHIRTDFEPEDWQGLVDYIAQASTTQLPHRDQLLQIARRDDLTPDARERLMRRRYPRDFAHLLEHCLPRLRHTDYTIEFDRSETRTLRPTATEAHAVTSYSMPALARRPQPVYQPPQPFEAIFALKTNVLFDLAAAFNIEAELPLGRNGRWSIMAEYWTPWYVWRNNSRAYQLQVGGAELRHWTGRCRDRRAKLTGLFLGAYCAIGHYDVETRADSGDQGEFTSLGVTVGYAWPIHRRLNLELSASAGWLHGPRRHYHGELDQKHLIWDYTSSTTYVGPTKLKLSLAWLLGRASAKSRKEAAR